MLLLLSSLQVHGFHLCDKGYHMWWISFNVSLAQIAPGVLLRNDFTLKTASYFFIGRFCCGEHWVVFSTGQLMLHENRHKCLWCRGLCQLWPSKVKRKRNRWKKRDYDVLEMTLQCLWCIRGRALHSQQRYPSSRHSWHTSSSWHTPGRPWKWVWHHFIATCMAFLFNSQA